VIDPSPLPCSFCGATGKPTVEGPEVRICRDCAVRALNRLNAPPLELRDLMRELRRPRAPTRFR